MPLDPFRTARYRLAPLVLGILAATAALSPPPAAADWLVTPDGAAIETDGPWKVKGRMVVFTDAQGTLRSLRLSEIDLAASEATTEAGGPASATPAPAEEPEKRRRKAVMALTNDDVPPAAEDRPAAELAASPSVVMYSTSWCGYCRKTRQLLRELAVDFVEKDIEKSAEARAEHARLAQGSGVPVLDVAGTIVRGYDPDAIRAALAKLERPAEPEQAGGG